MNVTITLNAVFPSGRTIPSLTDTSTERHCSVLMTSCQLRQLLLVVLWLRFTVLFISSFCRFLKRKHHSKPYISFSKTGGEEQYEEKTVCDHRQENATYSFPRCIDTGCPGSCTPHCSSGPGDRDTHVSGHTEPVLFPPPTVFTVKMRTTNILGQVQA